MSQTFCSKTTVAQKKHYPTNSQKDVTIQQKGRTGEKFLNRWFQEHGITYFPIQQDAESFMHTFANVMKRPDFFILLEGVSMIAVDSKNYKLSAGYFTLNKEELTKAIAYEMITKMPFWFAYLDQSVSGNRWYWISALKAMEVGITRVNGKTKEEFLAISISKFISIEKHDDIAKLYTQQSTLSTVMVPVKVN